MTCRKNQGGGDNNNQSAPTLGTSQGKGATDARLPRVTRRGVISLKGGQLKGRGRLLRTLTTYKLGSNQNDYTFT